MSAQILLFEPRKGMEASYVAQLETFLQWAKDGRITFTQYQNFRRQSEYQIIMQKRREGR